jgi:hypothetical protein
MAFIGVSGGGGRSGTRCGLYALKTLLLAFYTKPTVNPNATSQGLI